MLVGREGGQVRSGRAKGGWGEHVHGHSRHSLGFLSPQVQGKAPDEVVFPLLQLQGFSAFDVTDELALLFHLHLIGAWRGGRGKLSGSRGGRAARQDRACC